MKKISEWLQELPDGYRERALSQILIDTEEESLSEAVWCFNDFDHTKEGYGFWSAVANHCEGIWDLPALPDETSPLVNKCIHSPFTQDAETRKTYPVYTGLVKYFPDALARVANISCSGGAQHGHTEIHWDREKSPDEPDALMRHMIDYAKSGNIDELSKVVWRSLAWLQKESEAEQEKI